MARAESAGHVEFSVVNPRNYTYDPHKKVDDIPYGGHPGMLMKAEPVALAIEAIKGSGSRKDNSPSPFLEAESESNKVDAGWPSVDKGGGVGVGVPDQEEKVAIILTEPSGIPFTQAHAQALSKYDQIIFVCGHYEGIDHRIEETFATHVFSIGDYILTNGELPALVMADAVTRLLPGVLGNENSLDEESFQNNLLGAPNYTRPEVWRGKAIPEVLKSGNHKAIDKWRLEESKRRTKERRPDLESP